MREKMAVWVSAVVVSWLGLLGAPLAGRCQAVQAWTGEIRIPTFELGPTDPNPAFPLTTEQPVYPYSMLDDLTDNKVAKTYKTLYLENDFLKITILPQLGGHVYSVYDKTAKREMLYRDNVIKYGLVGPRGAWISGGMEFSFPFAHTMDTVSTVESRMNKNPDGSATVRVGALDWVSGMHWEIGLTLRPRSSALEEQVTLFNGTPNNHLYLFWTNTAISATQDLQYIYPMRETISDDPFATVQGWPVWKGVDESWYKNNPDAAAYFARNVQRNFFGAYYHDADYGVVHVADYHQDPGKKIWTWGTSQSGKIWDNILSDSDGSYNEIQSGRFPTQGFREFLQPRRVESWVEYWYPVTSLHTGFVEATPAAALNVETLDPTGNRPMVRVLLSPAVEAKDATLSVSVQGKVVKQSGSLQLVPMQPQRVDVPLGTAAEAKMLEVDLTDAEGKVLLHWNAADPVDGNTEYSSAVGKTVEQPIPDAASTPIEALFRHGQFLQKTNDLIGAQRVYDEVLQRDPGYVPALEQEAWIAYAAADLDHAESLLQLALERGQTDPSVNYALGVVDRARGDSASASDHLWTAIHYGDHAAPAYVELGEIALRQGQPAEAQQDFANALRLNPEDAAARTDLAVAERLAGKVSGQAETATALQQMPLLPYAIVESGMDAHSGTVSASDWRDTVGSDPENYLAVAAWYHGLGDWKASDTVLHRAQKDLPRNEVTPMFLYFLASNARHEGDLATANAMTARAEAMKGDNMSPNRLEDVAVLKEELASRPQDANAQYALSTFYFAHGRYPEAAALWSAAESEGMRSAVLQRNLAVYQWKVEKDLAAAEIHAQQAIALDPQDYRLYQDLDQIYEEDGHTAARITLMSQAPRPVQDQDIIRARRAILAMEQLRFDDALAILQNHRFKPWENGVIIHNMFVFANIEKGKLALNAHHPEEAEANFRQAALYPADLGTGEPSHPDTSEALYWLGVALQQQGKTDAAEAAWTASVDHAMGMQGLPVVYAALSEETLGHHNQSLQLLDAARKSAIEIGGAKGHYTLGILDRIASHSQQAQAEFNAALKQDLLFWQARVALSQGQ